MGAFQTLPLATSVDRVNDYLGIDTANVTTTQKINVNTLLGTSGTLVDTTSVQTLFGKTAVSLGQIGTVTGWVGANETWVYASASSITVPSDATTKYSVGDKLVLIQGGAVKYFYVTAVAATVLIISVSTDYILTNVTISAPAYSKALTPLGFPTWFNYPPTWTGFSTSPSGGYTQFNIVGRVVTVNLNLVNPGTSNTTTCAVSIPVTGSPVPVRYQGFIGVMDNSAQQGVPGSWTNNSATNATYVSFFKDFVGTPWTASGNKNVFGSFFYGI